MTYFGDTLRALRVEAGLDQRDAASRARWSRGHISRLECGRRPAPTPSTVRQLADRVGLPVGPLVAAAILDRWSPDDLAEAYQADPYLRRLLRRGGEA